MWLCGFCGFCGFCVSNIRQNGSTSHFARFWSLWISCGSCVGRFVVFGRVWFLGLVLRVRSTSCGFCGSVVLPSMPKPTIARPFALCGSVVLPSMPGLARPLARRSCASSGFPYCQKTALELQALDRDPPLVVPTKRRACAWLALACWSLWSCRSSLTHGRLDGNQNSRMRAQEVAGCSRTRFSAKVG